MHSRTVKLFPAAMLALGLLLLGGCDQPPPGTPDAASSSSALDASTSNPGLDASSSNPGPDAATSTPGWDAGGSVPGGDAGEPNPGSDAGTAPDASCGNGVLEPGEQCDVPFGCDSRCQLVPPPIDGTFIDDQDFVIPSNAENGDTVGNAKHHPTVILVSPAYSIVGGNTGNAFAIGASTGELTVANAAALTPSIYSVETRVVAQATDTAVMRIDVRDASKVVFVDPNASATGADGTRAHPFKSWAGVGNKWASGKAYLQRRGTTTTETTSLDYFVDDVLVGAYGAGARPAIAYTGSNKTVVIGANGVTVRDLDLGATTAASCSVHIKNNTDSNVVDDCALHGGQWGLRIANGAPNKHHRILYTEVHHVLDDGMFIQDAEDVEVGYAHVHHVNQNWQPPWTDETAAGGDGIQFNRVTTFRVHHSKLDRSHTGNKFCLIATEASGGTVEHNLLFPPRPDGTAFYSAYESTGMTFRYNTVAPGLTPVPADGVVDGHDAKVFGLWVHSPAIRIYGNVLAAIPNGVFCGQSAGATCAVANNVFYDVPRQLSGNQKVDATNNIFFLSRPGDSVYSGTPHSTSHNLHSSGTAFGAEDLVGDPKFVDAAGGDFHVLAGSPAIDSGAVVSGVAQDRAGTSIPQGGGPDLGIYER
ncbi:MAG: cadherin repeat domain-containing protein [Myxococcales bacterium]